MQGTDNARRRYWTQQMDAAYAFMETMGEFPVKECGEPLVSLQEAATAAGVEVRFSDTRIAGRFDRIFFLREGLIAAFAGAARAMNARGWILKIEDGFRSVAMQKSLALQENILDAILGKVIWEGHGALPEPDLMFRRLTALIATCPKIGTHMSGTAMDISVVRADDDAELERDGPYLEMSERTPMDSPFITEPARTNRAAITALMRDHGFVAYPYEFWHYNQGDAYAAYLTGNATPARYGPVHLDAATGRVAPIEDPKSSFHSMEDIRTYIQSSLDRLES